MRAMVPRPSVVTLTARMRSAWRKDPSGEGVWLRAPSMRTLSSNPPRDHPVAAMASHLRPTTTAKAISPLVRTGWPATCQMRTVMPVTRSEPMTRSMTPATTRALTGAGASRRRGLRGPCAVKPGACGGPASSERRPWPSPRGGSSGEAPSGAVGASGTMPDGLTLAACDASVVD